MALASSNFNESHKYEYVTLADVHKGYRHKPLTIPITTQVTLMRAHDLL